MQDNRKRIPVDFNSLDPEDRGRIWINPKYTGDLQIGEQVILYEENDMQVEAILEFNGIHNDWYGIPDWSTRIVI